ncbi:hypothetical protein B0H13DRAFT_1643347 [Mycena leptocephala]|nr:hypothetical protein B0H13DRAFT_1643347 [Mycena leptocephala]
MHSFTTFTVAAVLLGSFVVKAAIIAWSGDHCDGDEGGNAPCDGSCISFDGRHSFKVRTNLHATHRIRIKSCIFADSFQYGPLGASAGCINVNTGTGIGSFRCSPNSNCILKREGSDK